MSHSYAARASRQTAVLTAIAGFHIGLFMVIAMGLVPRMVEPPPTPIPITPLPPKAKPEPILVRPSGVYEGLVVDIIIDEPLVDVPLIKDAVVGPDFPDEAAGSGGETGYTAPRSEHIAPAVRTGTGSLAALIASCYPAASRRLNEEGRVIAEVLIGAEGKALSWSIAHSSGFARLDAATACVVRKLDFIAGRKDGQAVAAVAMLPIVFRLD